MILTPVVVIGLGKNLLLKSVLGHCETLLLASRGQFSRKKSVQKDEPSLKVFFTNYTSA